jgi:sugar/nucleoside kinase (ribokinase family)
MNIIEKKNNSTLIVGVGSALVDILLQESDQFLEKTDAQKGGMILVEAEKIDSILSRSNQEASQVPGGSACNTIIGIGNLGNKARFIGKRGDDTIGETLEQSLIEHRVEPVLDLSTTPTGRVLSIITPDTQRSMFTYLGAASETKPEEITIHKFKDAALVHIEGYLLFNEELIVKALKTAKEAGALISLDLASFTVVEASKKILSELVREYVDIILANEDEARVYTGLNDETRALEALSKDAEIAVLKVGVRGSFISFGGQTYQIGIQGSGEAIDTTGAGDLWASGFLYGLVNGLPVEKCGSLGAACGYEVCQVIGAHIPEDGWKRIRSSL